MDKRSEDSISYINYAMTHFPAESKGARQLLGDFPEGMRYFLLMLQIHYLLNCILISIQISA